MTYAKTQTDPEVVKRIRHGNYRDNAKKIKQNKVLLNQGLKAIVVLLRDNGATNKQVKAFYKSVSECKNSYYTNPMEKAVEAVMSKIVPLEYYLRGISGGTQAIREAKCARAEKLFAPAQDRLRSLERNVQSRMRDEIGKTLAIYMGAGEAPEGKIKVPTSHDKQVKNLGLREVNGRFILSAEAVDKVGEFELFQVSYVTRGESEASSKLQWGFIATFNGNHHAFAQSPSRAMSAAKTNMVKTATAKLAR